MGRLPDTRLDSPVWIYSRKRAEGRVTEERISTRMGQQWESPSGLTCGHLTTSRLQGGTTLEDMLNTNRSLNGVIYGTVSLYSPRRAGHNHVRRQRARG